MTTVIDTMVGFHHDAFVYGSDDEFLATLVPLVGDGVARGEPVMAVLTKRHIDLLRSRLGSLVASVDFVDADDWYQQPIATIAGYRRVTAAHVASGAARVRVIGEVPFGRSDHDDVAWTRYEAALNRALDDLPVWVVCPYDAATVPAPVVHDARRTHPSVVSVGGRTVSDAYAPGDVVRSFAPAVSMDGAVLLATRTVHGKLAAIRSTVRAVASQAGLDLGQLDDFVTAVNEIIANALTHGGGAAHVALWQTDAGIVCEVSDTGRGVVDDFIGYGPCPDRLRGEGGLGVWIARQLCDVVEFVPCTHGATVRMRAAS